MKNIANALNLKDIIGRIDVLQVEMQRLWGIMTVAQMLLHSLGQIRFCPDEGLSKTLYLASIQWLVKQAVGFRIPWTRNSPTAPAMISLAEFVLDFDA